MIDSLDSEQVLVGICLCDPSIIEQVGAKVRPDDFTSSRMQKLYALVLELSIATPGAVDPVQVITVLEDRNMTQTVAGREDIKALMAGVPSSAYAETHVEAVLERSRRNRLETAARTVLADLAEGKKSSATLRRLESGVAAVEATRGDTGLISSRDASMRLHASLGKRGEADHQSRMIPAPVDGVTNMLGGGFSPGELVVICGRAGMGKSVYAECMSDLASNVDPVLYASMEMSAEQMMQRAWARHASVALPNLRTARGPVAEKLHRMTGDLASRMAASRVFYMDDTDIDAHAVRSAAMGLQKRQGLSMVVVDYIGLLREPPEARSRQEAIAQASRFFKRMALTMNVTVVLVAQLNRELERRDDKRPKLSDLRESGALEQDADRVIALHRPSYYGDNSSTDRILILKNRTGPTGEVPAEFNTTKLSWTAPPFADPFQQ